jgi:2-dehydro-3-deoxygluconokinase
MGGDVHKSAEVWKVLQEHRLIALLNPQTPDECVQAYEVLAPLGVVLEVAMRGDAALPGMRAVLTQYSGALLLAGTVMTRRQAEAVIAAGVAGVVSADYVPSVVEACVAQDVMCVPGGLADVGKQLVQKAEQYDCTLPELRERRPWQWVYKVFPAMADESAVREMTRHWRSVYPGLTLVYTGGITLENVGRLARADANGIFCGSAVVRHADDPDRLRADAERWLGAVRQEPVSEPTGARAQPEQARPRAVTLGEIMLRLSPPPGRRIRTATSYDATYGGAEANVAAALAQWGVDSRYVTALPANELGQGAIDLLRGFGVNTAHIVREGDRIGVYYLEHGASQRPSRVIYDRAHSAITDLRPGRIDWDAAFSGAAWFHWTGITPALSDSMAAVTAEAMAQAKRLGITVSVDLNYRSRLWSKDRARAVMTPLVEQADVLIANEEDAANVFGITAAKTDVERGKLDVAAYEDVARQLVDRFDLELAAITLRESHSASVNSWSACLWDGREFLHSTSYRVQLVDRVGGGDAFAAGLMRGLLVGMSHAEALEFGVAASCLKQTMLGDVAVVSVAEVEALMKGSGAGRITR